MKIDQITLERALSPDFGMHLPVYASDFAHKIFLLPTAPLYKYIDGAVAEVLHRVPKIVHLWTRAPKRLVQRLVRSNLITPDQKRH